MKTSIALAAALSACSSSTVTFKAVLVTPGSAPLAAGEQVLLSAIAVQSDGSTKDVTADATWTSGDAAKASVASGKVTALSAGTAVISAAYNGKSAQATITVTAATLRTVIVTAPSARIAAGYSEPLTATGWYSDGTQQPLTASTTWSSNAVGVADAAGGTLQAKTAGTATITATSSGVSGTLAVTVTSATLSSITITPPSPSLAAGTKLGLRASGQFSDQSAIDLSGQVEWNSSNGAIASVDSAGVLSGNSSGGPVTITAAAGGASGTAQVTVSAALLLKLTVNGPAGSMAPGATRQLRATGSYSDGSAQNLTASWSSQAASIASVDSATGVVTAHTAGSATIQATHTASGLTATLAITVATPVAQRLLVSPGALTLAKGAVYQLSAFGLDADGGALAVSGIGWSSDAAAIATVDSGGRLTAHGTGTAHVTATDSADALTASATVTVVAGDPVALAIAPGNATLALGARQHYTARGIFADGSSTDLTAQSDFSSDSGSATFDGNLLSAADTGSATLTAHDPVSGLSAQTQVTISAASVVGLYLQPSAVSVATGGQVQLTCYALDSGQVLRDVTSQVTWSTSDSDTAGVDTGLVTGGAVGTATITAHTGNLTATAQVTVTPPFLVNLAVTPQNGSVANGQNLQMVALGAFSDGSHADLTAAVLWSSSDRATLDILSTGLTRARAQGGPVTITAKHVLSGLTATAQVTVTAPLLKSIVVTPAVGAALTGATAQFKATGIYTDGSFGDITSQVDWSIGDTSIGSVTAGTAAGVHGGSTQVRAASTGLTGSARFDVSLSGAPRLTATPSFDPDPIIAGGVETITFPLSDPGYMQIHLQDQNGASYASNTIYNLQGLSTVQAQVQVSCAGAGATVYADPYYVYSPEGGYTYYYSQPVIDASQLYYTPQQTDNSSYTGGIYTPVQLAVSTIAPPAADTCIFPKLVGAPVISGPVVLGGSTQITVPISTDTTTVEVQLFDYPSGNNLGYASTNVNNASTATLTLQGACLASKPQVYLWVRLTNPGDAGTSTHQSVYTVRSDLSTQSYSLQQSDSIAAGQWLLTSIPVATASTSPAVGSSCQYPRLTGAVGLPATITQGVNTSVTLPVSTDTTYAYVALYNAGNGNQLSSGNDFATNAGGTSVTVPVRPYCLPNSTPAQVYATVMLIGGSSSNTGQRRATYSRDLALSSSKLVITDHDSEGTANEVLTTLTLPVAAWQSNNSCTITGLSGQPAIDKTTVAHNSSLTVTLPIDSSASQVQLWAYDLNGNNVWYQGTSISNQSSFAKVVNIDSNFQNGKQYYFVIRVYGYGNSEYSYYDYEPSISPTNYIDSQSQYASRNGVSTWTIPFFTVSDN